MLSTSCPATRNGRVLSSSLEPSRSPSPQSAEDSSSVSTNNNNNSSLACGGGGGLAARLLRTPAWVKSRDAARRRWLAMCDTLRPAARLRATLADARWLMPGGRRRSAELSGGAGPSPGASSSNPPAASGSSPSPSSSAPRLSPNEWAYAFHHVINDTDGRNAFTKFLQSEYSEENILFWWAVEELRQSTTAKTSENRGEWERAVRHMFDTFIASDSPLAINIDHDTRHDIIERVQQHDPSEWPLSIYERAQAHVYRLMEKDCFSRFVHTPAYKELAKKLSLPQSFRFNGRLSPI